MKIFWKQFMGIIGIVLATFTLFGVILIYSSFQMNLDKVKTQTVQNLGIYQYSILTSIENLPEDYRMTSSAAADIAKTISQSMGSTSDGMSLYDESGNLLYQSAGLEELGTMTFPQEGGLQRIVSSEGVHYLENTLRMESSKGSFVLRLDQNIEYIYESRRQLYHSYQRILLLVLVIAMGLAGIVCGRFTRPIRQLRTATERFARGEYRSRVKESGRDEITDLMRAFNSMAEQLENNIQELEETARKQEEFTAAFAHELKTPLTSIIGYSEAMRTMELSKEEQRTSMDYIYQQGRRLESLSYKMMELTGVRKQQWEFGNVPVKALVDQVRQMTADLLEQKQIRLVCSCEPGMIYGDEQLLQSLLSNLIDNARKASPENFAIEITGTGIPHGYRLEIRDHGCGIPKGEIHKIQEAFYMVDKSRGRKEGGAGIGMALCEQILLLHHGTWDISSEVGRGTIVTLEFSEVDHEESS